MKVQIKKLIKDAIVPVYAKPGDAGLDLTAVTRSILKEEETGQVYQAEYGTGLAIKIPEGYVGLIFPRSSIKNKDMILTNSVGVIDSGYTGEIKLFFAIANDENIYDVGERVAQLIIIPYPKIEFEEVEELPETERGSSGFGSSGN